MFLFSLTPLPIRTTEYRTIRMKETFPQEMEVEIYAVSSTTFFILKDFLIFDIIIILRKFILIRIPSLSFVICFLL